MNLSITYNYLHLLENFADLQANLSRKSLFYENHQYLMEEKTVGV